MSTVILVVILFLPLSTQLDYFCHPNGTFVIDNARTIFDAVKIIDDNKTCKSTFNQDKTVLTLDRCTMDQYVTIIFYQDTGLPVFFTRSNSKAYKIMCRKIPPQGVEVSVSLNLGVRTHVEEIEQETETTQVTRIFSHVEDQDSPKFEQIRLNNKFEWIFEIHENYSTLPVECTAYAGRDATADVENMTLVENGCSKNSEVISNFEQIQNPDSTKKNRYSLQFTVFRFDNNPFITVVCSMRLCPDIKGHNCNAECDRRRRRALRRSRDTVSDTVNDKVVVLEILDETSTRSESTHLSSDNVEKVFRRLLDELSSSGAGVNIGTYVVSIQAVALFLLISFT